MASAAHDLERQRSGVETLLKSIVNNDLKEICKAYNCQVSGTKAVLQKRCLQVLDTIIDSGDIEGFREFHYRVGHHGQPPPSGHHASFSVFPSNSATASDLKGYSSNYGGMPSAVGRGMSSTSKPPVGKLNFKNSPFYDVLETVTPTTYLPVGPDMPQNRNTVRATITLSSDQVSHLNSDRNNLKLMLFCGNTASTGLYTAIDVAFPSQLEVKVNGDDVRANFKGLKNKPGSTKPADITPQLRLKPGYQNQLSITYALTQKSFALTVLLVRYVTAETLTQRIRDGKHGGGIISRQKVLDEMKSAADDDLGVTSVRMSLKDPISTLRITIPVRSIVCKHNQCFDGAMFLQLQDQAPQWTCPVCNKNVTYEQLCVDKYFEDILDRTSKSIEKVDIEPDGQWTIIKEEEEVEPNGYTTKSSRASYDDDFDDDLIDITEPSNQQANGVGIPPRPAPLPEPQGFPVNATPSSRGPSVAPSTSSNHPGSKRPNSSVIDLTLSDDDEPPRPAKRQFTSTHQHNLPFTTPSSLSDAYPNMRYHSHSAPRGRATDSYRPSSNDSRPVSLGSNGVGNSYSNSNALSRATASPFQQAHPTGPYQYAGGSPWPPQGSRNGIPPALRPIPLRGSSTPQSPALQGPAPGHTGGMPLTPISGQAPDGDHSGWRSGYSSYSHSPPG